MTSTDDPAAIGQGWSGRDLLAEELVDDDWIIANTAPGRKPRRLRDLAARTVQRARTFGVDPLENTIPGEPPVEARRGTTRLPRLGRRVTLQAGGLTRDQMRRIAQRTGYPYVEAWSAHNKGNMRGVWGVLLHHTGTSWAAAGDYPTLRVVRDGRTGLVNSLCAFGLGRSGTVYLVNNQVSWHAGVGNYKGITDGNGYLAGIEAESDGAAGHWTPQQVDSYPRLVASILIEIKQDDTYSTRHATYATPAGRKNDFAGWPGGPDAFWNQVYAYLKNPASITKGAGGTEHLVLKGETLWAIARKYSVTVAQIKDWNGLTADTIAAGQHLKVTAASAPPPPPPPPPPATPQRLAWSLPAGHYYGSLKGPAKSHGGYHTSERPFIKNIQQWLVYKGCVSGVPSNQWATSDWADGRWEAATDTAMKAWHDRFYKNQPNPTQCWSDDYNLLAKP